MGAIAEDVRRDMLDDEVRLAGRAAWSLYQSILAAGETREWAAMCALRQAPGSKNTDRAFSEGARRQMNGMSEVNRRKLLEVARKAGINTQGKCYKGGLGRADDPAAWVSTADDVIAVAKAKQLDVSGVVNVNAGREVAPKKVALAPDIVARLEKEYCAADPALKAKVVKSPKARRELRERIVATHGSRRK